MKCQLLIEEKKGCILEVATSAEQEHDLRLARRYAHHLPVASVCAVDLGYVGFVIEGCFMVFFKNTKKRELQSMYESFKL